MDKNKDTSDTGLPDRIPTGRRRSGSYLVDETTSMDRQRRLLEQQGERKLADVKARERFEEQSSSDMGDEVQEKRLQHPNLDSQYWDGVPPPGTEERRKFDKEIEKQKDEKQLRLGLMPKFSTAPTPRRGP